MVNNRERFASAILVITLAIGIVAGILDRDRTGEYLPATNDKETSSSDDHSSHAFLRLDINRATVDELMALPGIGPARAGAIADWRDRNGFFEKVEDLVAVRGIGRKTLDRMRMYICVDRGDSLAGK